VVHTAAIVSFAPKDKSEMYRINVEGTANVINACLVAGVQKLCHVSSNAALGKPDPKRQSAGTEVVIDEEQRWEESSSNSYYSKTKYLAELEVWRGISEGLDAVIVNPSVVLGEGDWNKSSTRLFRYAYDEKPFYTAGRINYVDVRDVAKAICTLLFSDITAERFLLNAGSIGYKSFFGMIADAFGKKRPSIKVGKIAASIIWRFEAVRTFITQGSPLITKETARSATRHYSYNSAKVQEKLGLTFTPLEETIARVCQSFK
jgi:dihydroflavonol-4-reductase